MSLLTVDNAKRLAIGGGLSQTDLQAVIDDEERWLARVIGPLTGNVTQLIYGSGYGSLWLNRPAAAVVSVTDAFGSTAPVLLAATDYQFIAPARIVVGWGGGYWTGPVQVVYTPGDSDGIKLGIADLVRLRLTDRGVDSASGAAFSFSRLESVGDRRSEIVAGLVAGKGIG